jgi:hypothetical protein
VKRLAAAGVEGALSIHLDTQCDSALIRSSRPVLASRALEGKTIADAMKMLPILFNICGQAQQTAAIRAIESALDIQSDVATEAVRSQLIQLETLRELVWQTMIDWPRWLDEPPATPTMSSILAKLNAARRALDLENTLCALPGNRVDALDHRDFQGILSDLRHTVSTALFGMDSRAWVDALAADPSRELARYDTQPGRFLRWIIDIGWASVGTTMTRPLPAIPDHYLAQCIDSERGDHFIREPAMPGGGSAETGTLARQTSHSVVVAVRRKYGSGLLTRLVARLVEVAEILDALREVDHAGLAPPATPGIAQLEAARGRLCHRIRIEGDRITRFRILAPTEWNFGPGGPALQALNNLQRTSSKEQRLLQAELLIAAIDPCVGFRLVVDQAEP